jgi:antitoxin MazE
MQLSIINIGDAKGIILPKTILKKYSIGDKIELIPEKGYIILKSKSEPRKNWEKAFEKMHANGDDQLLMKDFFEDESFEE